MFDSPRVVEGLATVPASEPRDCQSESVVSRPFREEFQYFALAFLESPSVGFWDQIRYTGQTLLEGVVGRIDDALAYTWRFADVESGDEKFAWVVRALISGDDLFNFLIPGFDRFGTFRVKSFVPLDPHKLEYTVLAGIPHWSGNRRSDTGQDRILEKNCTLIGHWLGRTHRRQALYAFVPILVFLKLVLPTECFEPRNDPDRGAINRGWLRSLRKVTYSSYLLVRSSSFSS